MAGLARQLRDTGISVNVISPGGMVDTRMVPDRPNMVRERDLLRPEGMNDAILWLVSDASNGVTGQRMNARLWNPKLPPTAAAIKALAPIAWSPLDP
jgi:NAD(P)-dependent dehydrogenase (short-subunit alcohol dehydrogenase family)